MHMNGVRFLFLVAIVSLACQNVDLYGQAESNSSLAIFEIDNSKIKILNVNKKAFRILLSKDTAVFENISHGTLNGKTLTLDSDLTNIQVMVKYGFSFLQYTIDETPAYPIPYLKYSDWIGLEMENNYLRIPDYYGNSDAIRVHEIMGYKNLTDISDWLETLDFENIRTISFEEQKSFFKNLMENKQAYEECCKYYIEQAKKILNSSIEDYTAISNLNLELYPEKIIIVITGNSQTGKPFQKIIVEKQNLHE